MVTEEQTAKMARLAVWKVKLVPAGHSRDRAPRAQVEVQEREVLEEAVLEASKTVNRAASVQADQSGTNTRAWSVCRTRPEQEDETAGGEDPDS